jgi:hypothetical protein
VKTLSRRDALKMGGAAAAAMLPAALEAAPAKTSAQQHGQVPVWEVFEIKASAPAEGNPFLEVTFAAEFRQENRTVQVNGFYDGDGRYKIRFMPDAVGTWTYSTQSSAPGLNGKTGSFEAVTPLPGAHGPIVVHNTHHFSHADGAPYFPFGTTCYAWIHQTEALQQQTLATLKSAPFNKIRMCVFPKHYEYNHNEPEFYPFPRSADGVNDYTQFDPRFFAHLEQRVLDLQTLGIECDLILFHPYDRWGYAAMPAEVDDRYLRYVVARLGAYRNIWWSMANEWDFMKAKKLSDFDRLFRVLQAADTHSHLRSIHHGTEPYDYSKLWITHSSLQMDDFTVAPKYLALAKPVVFDEVKYEGNLNKRWGNISANEMARRFWLGVISGCYVTHGETYLPATSDAFNEDTTPTLWWAHGGTLHGESLPQIAQLRKLLEESAPAPAARMGFVPPADQYYLNAIAYGGPDGKTAHTVLYYLDQHQPIWHEFALPAGEFTAELIDPASGTITPVAGTYSSKAKLQLKVKPYQAVRFRSSEALSQR